jgi:hypothetical protein
MKKSAASQGQSASELISYAARAISSKDNKSTGPPSKRWFVKPSPSTVPASRKLREKRSPERSWLAEYDLTGI